MEASAQISPVPEPFDYEQAFIRNLGIFSATEQACLKDKHVAVPGCGGVGSLHATLLARSGVGRFSVADFDSYELANFNRQAGARISTLGAAKADTTRDDILDINPTAHIRTFPEGLNCENIGLFLLGVDLVIDSLDFFAHEARRLLFAEAKRAGIPVLTAAPLGLSCALLYFSPEGMSFDEYFNFLPQDSLAESHLKFAVGLAPKGTHLSYVDPSFVNLKDKTGPSHVVGVALCAALATIAAETLLLGRGKIKAVPHYLQFDAYTHSLKKGWLPWGNKNPWQRLKIRLARHFYLKSKEPRSHAEGL